MIENEFTDPIQSHARPLFASITKAIPADLTKDSADFIKWMPKAELHIHLESALSKPVMEKLAKKHNFEFPAQLYDDEGNIPWDGFLDFLAKYDVVSNYINTAEILTDVTYQYLKYLASVNAIYAELMVSPEHFIRHNMDNDATMAAVIAGIKKAEAKFDIDARILFVLVRNARTTMEMEKDERECVASDACMEILNAAIKGRENNADQRKYVVGMNLAGNEKDFPPVLFIEHFRKARESGLSTVAHAGEWTNAQDVSDAVMLLQANRVGHGVHSIFDEAVLDLLLEKGIHLELSPCSNHALGTHYNYPEGSEQFHPPGHPITVIDKKGIRYSGSSDDPPFFKTNLQTIYEHIQRLLSASPEKMIDIVKITIEDCFAEPSLKAKLMRKIEVFADRLEIAQNTNIGSLKFSVEMDLF